MKFLTEPLDLLSPWWYSGVFDTEESLQCSAAVQSDRSVIRLQ